MKAVPAQSFDVKWSLPYVYGVMPQAEIRSEIRKLGSVFVKLKYLSGKRCKWRDWNYF